MPRGVAGWPRRPCASVRRCNRLPAGMKTVGILPVKLFARAKQRLAPELGTEARAALAEAMVRDVLRAVARVEELDGLIVVTKDPRAAALGPPFGAGVLNDADE